MAMASSALLAAAGLINLAPAIGVLSAARIERLYGLSVSGQPDLEILLRHRAALFGLLGAAMMVWLAWEGWRGEGESSTSNIPPDTSQRNLVAGFVINLLNPKATLFLVTVMPQFVAGGQPSYAQALSLGAVSVVVATLIHLALVFAAEPLRPALMDSARAKLVRRILALAMLGVAAWFISKAI